MSAPTGRLGIEPFDVGYGAGFQVDDDGPAAVDGRVVEGDGELAVHDPAPAARPDVLAFVDGSMRTEARLTWSTGGTTSVGIAGATSAGAVVCEGASPLRFDEVVCGRYAIWCGGEPVALPEQRGGWSWHAESVAEQAVEAAVDRLQRHMRDDEVAIAERLCRNGVLTVVDGPLTNVRSGRDLPVIGYVKTHHRRLLPEAQWAEVPRVGVGQRTSVFEVGERAELYGTYLRVGDPGPWASPWGGIVRLEVPSGVGVTRAIEVLDGAAAWLPAYASVPHRDPRAPVNLTPVGGLEKRLRHLQGDLRLAVRAVRAAVVEANEAVAA